MDAAGRVTVAEPGRTALQLANSETGVVQDLPTGWLSADLTQAVRQGAFAFNWLGCDMGAGFGAQAGRAKGDGRADRAAGGGCCRQMRGGGQEMGRRAGTENLIGIAGFGAAAEAAARDLAMGLGRSRRN